MQEIGETILLESCMYIGTYKQIETVLHSHSSQLISSLTLIEMIFQTDSSEKECNSSLCHVRTAVNLFCKKEIIFQSS